MIIVTCAIIRNEENEILIVQKVEATDHPFKWEFPGGKLKDGETDEECILREVDEELSMEVVICGKLPEVEYDYGHKQIRLIPFICDTLDELPFLSEHLAYKWLKATELASVDFSEADVYVAKNYLERTKSDYTSENQAIPDTVHTSIEDADLQSMVNNMMSMKEAEWVATSAIENPAILYRLSLIYPELAIELSASIRILMEDASAGISARGRMILKKLTQIPINPKSNQL